MWYVVQTSTGKEDSFIELFKTIHPDNELVNNVFTIHYEKFYKIGGKMIKKKLALFPSYVFFATDFPDQLNLLLDDIPMYSKVLSYDLKPIPIEESEQEFLQQLINKENTVQTSTGIIEGDNLIILQGPLVGKEGEVIKIDRHKRTATLKVDFLGTTRIVKLGLEVVSKV